MIDKIKQLTDLSGKWIPTSSIGDILEIVVAELRLNGYDDAAQCLIKENEKHKKGTE